MKVNNSGFTTNHTTVLLSSVSFPPLCLCSSMSTLRYDLFLDIVPLKDSSTRLLVQRKIVFVEFRSRRCDMRGTVQYSKKIIL